MYTDTNFKSKKALRDAFTAGEQLTVSQPGGFFPDTQNGRVSIEGPHYPEPHKWYASVEIKEGVIIKILG